MRYKLLLVMVRKGKQFFASARGYVGQKYTIKIFSSFKIKTMSIGLLLGGLIVKRYLNNFKQHAVIISFAKNDIEGHLTVCPPEQYSLWSDSNASF